MRRFHHAFFHLPRAALVALLCTPLFACKMTNETTNVPSRNQGLPLFKPHVATFICEVEASKVPPIDAQAQDWFLEARALEDPGIYVGERDYKKIVQLTRQAADRRHWKAMLNLASLYLERRDPAHGVADAVTLVEEAMLLGIPAAYDRMGTYYINGTGVAIDATRAYAFWQKAAEMGSPHAMVFLAKKLNAGPDSEGGDQWSNIPVATKMLECAFAQGNGSAAFDLHYLYAVPRTFDGRVIGERTRETKARALKVLHEGVKLGCEDCANALQIEFDHPFHLATMLAPNIDKARGERYGVLGDALGFSPDRRFPNLDKVLPLPPAELPPWNGDRDTLLAAAMGVKPPPAPPPPSKPGAASRNTGRYFLDAAYALRGTGETTGDTRAPGPGYWKPGAPQQPEHVRAEVAKVAAGLHEADEVFRGFWNAPGDGVGPMTGVVWERCLTVRHNEGAVEPRAPAGLAREVPRPEPLRACAANEICPVGGTWQPWVHHEHPLREIVNQHWRQAWLLAGQAFPQPQRDWLLDLPERDVTWHLMDAAGEGGA